MISFPRVYIVIISSFFSQFRAVLHERHMDGSQSGTPTRVEIQFYGLHSDQASDQRTINHGTGQRQRARTLRKQV